MPLIHLTVSASTRGPGPRWQDLAACAETDPELWFPERGASATAAKGICRRCEVRGECLEYALDRGEARGVWGGLAEDERRQIRRSRAAA